MLKRAKLPSLFIIPLLLLSILTFPAHAIHPKEESSTLSDVVTAQLLPDPNLTETPNITIMGTSGEFDYSYDAKNTTAELVWQHTAGTSLDWGSKGFGWPDCLDHIRLTQDVFWSEYKKPDGLLVSMDAMVEATGDFAIQEDGLRMFDCAVYVKTFENPSDWYPILHFPTSANEFTIETRELSASSIDYAWDAVLEDCFNDDGETISGFEIVIALSPTYRFEDWVDFEAWLHYNGEVRLTIQSFSVETLLVEPFGQEDIHSPISSILISRIEGYTFTKDLEVTDDGSIYGLATIQPRTWHNPSDTYAQMLVKLNPDTSEFVTDLWYGNGSAVAMGIESEMTNLYTVGITRNTSSYSQQAYLTKWDYQGQLVWSKYWGDYYNVLELDVSVADDHSIFVVGMFYLEVGELIYTMTSEIRKFSVDGTLIWNKTIAEWYLPWWHGIQIGQSISIDNETIYIIEPYRISAWDLNGFQQWNRTTSVEYFHDVFIDGAKDVYTTSNNHTHFTVSAWKIQEENTRRITLSVIHDTKWTEYLSCQAAALTQNGSIITMLETYRYEPLRFLVQTDDKKLEFVNPRMNLEFPNQSLLPCSLAISSNNRIYVLSSVNNGTWINLMFNIYSISGAKDLDDGFVMIFLGIGLGTISIAIVLWARARRH
ncbi:MAG: hypothetical protein AM325_012905 [Candidatus Thorarchaeota archaeon SMTZ1-45]|nr:MAG: hypothetical protein AM325_14575 [Candidatus Thorarchaeota archaeon SMTZ1-45]